MKPYFFQKGIEELAHEVKGNENIYLGIRPYGFHAGNMLAFIIYPLLLCEEVRKMGVIPSFNIFIFINDWEPIILEEVSRIREKYPNVSVTSVRNSELKCNEIMKQHLLFTLKNPKDIANVIKNG